jgi:hypothetical protein
VPPPQLTEHGEALLGRELVVISQHAVQEALHALVEALVAALLVGSLQVCGVRGGLASSRVLIEHCV